MTKVGVYLRISDDIDGQQMATERLAEDCRRYAATKGWEVADVFEDIDTSAYQPKSKRPEFERMLEAVRTHAIDGVLSWRMDRISRRQRDLVRLDEMCEAAGGFIATVVEGIDTRQASGRFVGELLVSMARMESSNTSVRVKRAAEAAAKAGRPSPGGCRAFGYTLDRTAIIPQEADLIREGARRVQAGEGVRGICLDWERRGIVSPTGKPWQQSPLRRVLASGLVSGQRDYGGNLTPGTWPAILTPEDTASLRAILSNPTRRKMTGNGRAYLLSGFLRCGRCGGRLAGRPRSDHTKRYVCAVGPGLPNCGKIARIAAPVEEVVVEAVFMALDGADLREYVEKPNGHAQEMVLAAIKDDEAALEEASKDYYTEHKITRAEFFAAHDVLQGRLESNRASLAKANGHAVLKDILGAGELLRRQWPSKNIDQQRAIIAALVDHIIVEPAIKGKNIFDPDLIRIIWRF